MVLSTTPSEGVNFWELTVQEQREMLQKMNPDILAGVFNLDENTPDGMQLSNIENVLCCYPNQITDGIVKLPEDFWKGKIVIVNLGYNYETAAHKIKWMEECKGGVQKWKLELIAGNAQNLPEINTPILLSPGVIEYWEWKDGKKYTQTTLRDTWGKKVEWDIKWLAEETSRTTVAGRNFTWSLHEDLEIENAEESPFLMQDSEWDYFLVSHNLDYKSDLKASIKKYLQDKYLREWDANYKIAKLLFEKKFKGVSYDALWGILEDIVKNNRFKEYSWTQWNINWIDETYIALWNDEGNFYVYHDEANNTIEYRAIRQITWFPEWLKPVWRIPLRLFLESENQAPSFKRLENICRNGTWATTLVPTIQNFSDQVNLLVQKNKWLELENNQVADNIIQAAGTYPWDTGYDFGVDSQNLANTNFKQLTEFATEFYKAIPLSVIHQQEYKIHRPSRRSYNEGWDDYRVIQSSDSSVFEYGENVIKVYFELWKDMIQAYHQAQNKLSEIDFDIIQANWEYKWEEFTWIKINVLNIWNEIFWNEKQAVSFVPKSTSLTSAQGVVDLLNSTWEWVWLIKKMKNMINENYNLWIDKKLNINSMNIHLKGIKDRIIELEIVDVAARIANSFWE
jgi:hypothetical protein